MLCEGTWRQGTCIQGLAVLQHWFSEEKSLPWWKLQHRDSGTPSTARCCIPAQVDKASDKAPVRSGEFTAWSVSLPIPGTHHSEHTSLTKLCSTKCWTQGILIFSGCISTEELWMATNCSYYANETAHLEIADVALLKMQELLVWKVQFNKPSLLKTLKPQNTESLLLISRCIWLQVGGEVIVRFTFKLWFL